MPALFGAVVAVCVGGCDRAGPKIEADAMTLSQDVKSDLENAQKVRLFFSHHSVGANLLEGVRGISAAAGSDLKIVSLGNTSAASGPLWIEAVGGENGDPNGKVDFFVRALRDQPAFKPDLALMKFCYIDFDRDTDVNGVFTHYRDALVALKKDRPDVRFAHATVPLRITPTGIKSTIPSRPPPGRRPGRCERQARRVQPAADGDLRGRSDLRPCSRRIHPPRRKPRDLPVRGEGLLQLGPRLLQRRRPSQ